jgi:hypothetical protein
MIVKWFKSFFLVVALLATALEARATVVPVPTGLQPGDRYYLAFLTSGTINGTSSSIATYNAFVQGLANTAGLGTIEGESVTWKALVSTPTTSAVTNLGIGNFPIFRIDGIQMASGSSDLWDNSIAVPLNVTESGTTITTPGVVAWTGSNANGTPYSPYELGGSANLPIVGAIAGTTSNWIVVNALNPANTFRVYAFSEELVVPVPVPEPATIALASCGLALAGWSLRRRARKG